MRIPTGDRAGVTRFALLVFAVAMALGIHACRDLSTPTGISPKDASHSLNPAGTVVVLPDSMRGWAFYDDQNSTTCTAATVCSLVQGPSAPPLGDGSAELATTATSDGKALILVDYQGARLDRITTLSYSTYRQTADPGNNLAVALQLNADFDLSDAAVGYQGRLVFEPYQGNGGGVSGNTWQTWNARAGMWWGTKATVQRGGVNVPNPCVQATPCTWNQLLTVFPNAGIHATYGAVVLKAGSGWTTFRGNVDNLTIGIDGVSTTFDFELTRKLISLSYECGRRFRVTNRSASAVTLTWKVRGSTDSAIVTVPARSTDSTTDSTAISEFTTNTAGMTVIESEGVVVDSAANTGAACAGYRLRIIADDGVVFGTSVPRDSIYTPGAVVPFSFAPAAGRGTLVTVLDDTLASFSGTLTMNRDHVLYAETEAPVAPSAAVTDLVSRIRAVHSSTTPATALQNFMAWYEGAVDAVGVDVMEAQMDTANYLIPDTGADSVAVRQFESQVAGTEFLTYTQSSGATGRFYMTPSDWGYTPGVITSRAPSGVELRTKLADKMRLSASRSSIAPSMRGPSRSVDLADDQPDEYTDLIYVNGIYTREFTHAYNAGSAVRTAARLRSLAKNTPRFGQNGNLRSNVMVSYVYNSSMREQMDAWESDHQCEAEYSSGSLVLRTLHSLKRLANCKSIPFVLWVVENDLLESGKQKFLNIQNGIGSITEDSRKLAFVIRGHHLSQDHALLVGHSQGNLLISQALSKLPSIEDHPLNVDDGGCTAVLTLASPIARASYPGIDSHYLRGLTVEGDLLTVFHLANDFDVIHTPWGDAVARQPDLAHQWEQAVRAHLVDANYFQWAPSAARVQSELTALSDECDAGSFTISPNPMILAYGQTVRLAPSILNRAGRPLIGWHFQGGPLGLDVRRDSTATASLPTNGLKTGTVTLDRTNKVFATIQANVSKPQFNPSLTITKASWWQVTYFSGKLGATVEETPPNWDGMSPCVLDRTFANDSVVENVTRRCRLTMSADINWADYWNIRSIGVAGMSSIAPTSGGVSRAPNAGSFSGVILDCSDSCIDQGYILSYVNTFGQLVSADTIGGPSFARIPLAGPALQRGRPQPLNAPSESERGKPNQASPTRDSRPGGTW